MACRYISQSRGNASHAFGNGSASQNVGNGKGSGINPSTPPRAQQQWFSSCAAVITVCLKHVSNVFPHFIAIWLMVLGLLLMAMLRPLVRLTMVLLSSSMAMLVSIMAAIMAMLVMALRYFPICNGNGNASPFGNGNAPQFNNGNAPHNHGNGNASALGNGNGTQFDDINALHNPGKGNGGYHFGKGNGKVVSPPTMSSQQRSKSCSQCGASTPARYY